MNDRYYNCFGHELSSKESKIEKIGFRIIGVIIPAGLLSIPIVFIITLLFQIL